MPYFSWRDSADKQTASALGSQADSHRHSMTCEAFLAVARGRRVSTCTTGVFEVMNAIANHSNWLEVGEHLHICHEMFPSMRVLAELLPTRLGHPLDGRVQLTVEGL